MVTVVTSWLHRGVRILASMKCVVHLFREATAYYISESHMHYTLPVKLIPGKGNKVAGNRKCH